MNRLHKNIFMNRVKQSKNKDKRINVSRVKESHKIHLAKILLSNLVGLYMKIKYPLLSFQICIWDILKWDYIHKLYVYFWDSCLGRYFTNCERLILLLKLHKWYMMN